MLTRADLLDERDAARELAAAAAVRAHEAANELVDVLVVLARWGIDINRGHPAALVEHALRTVAHERTPA